MIFKKQRLLREVFCCASAVFFSHVKQRRSPIGASLGGMLRNHAAVLQVNFTLVAGNMEDVFKIKTVNHTYGEVFVNAPLDRESVDRYLLKVRQENSCINK